MDPEDIEACRPLFCLRHLLPLRLATVHGLHLSPRLGQLLLGTLGCGLRLVILLAPPPVARGQSSGTI